MADPESDGGIPTSDFLDELSTPIECAIVPEPLLIDALLAAPDDSVFRVVDHRWSEGGQRSYEGQRCSDGLSVWITEAWTAEGLSALEAESEIMASVTLRMIPERLAFWVSDGRAYLITGIRPGPSLEEAWGAGTLTFNQTLLTLTQVAYTVSRLHDAGWVHLGLRPGVIVPGKPACITRFTDSVKTGVRPRRTFFYSGYSSPEVFSGQPAESGMDIYSIGALLFHAINRTPLPESGAELSAFLPPIPVGGVPQLLHRCLGEPSTRYPTMAELHRDLLRLLKCCSPQHHYEVVAATDIGLESSRQTNQDSCGFLTGSTTGEEGRHDWAVLCLADGMGGMEGGEVASQTAVQAVLRVAAANASVVSDAAERNAEIKRWIDVANDETCAALNLLRARGGTTIVCASVSNGELVSAYVGDSRLYLIRQGKIEPLTRDHSLAMGLALQGEIPMEDLRHHPDRNKVTRSLGEKTPLPTYYADTLEVCTGRLAIQLEPGDILALCSDGVWEPLTDDEIASTVSGCVDMNAAARSLLNRVLERGAPDNATIVLLRVQIALPKTQESNDDSI